MRHYLEMGPLGGHLGLGAEISALIRRTGESALLFLFPPCDNIAGRWPAVCKQGRELT